MFQHSLLIFMMGLIAALLMVANAVPEIDRKCLDCICQASSNCDRNLRCFLDGGGYFCGPYVISWAYWHDGGRPGDGGGKHDFETCLTDKACAERAVQGYMRRYGRDCDGDGDIDGWDFARIHKLGFGACSGEGIVNSEYYQKFENCYGSQENSDEEGYGEEHLPLRHGR